MSSGSEASTSGTLRSCEFFRITGSGVFRESTLKHLVTGFPGGPMVKYLPASAGEIGSFLVQEDSTY